MFTATWKSKIPHTESYPLKASEVSAVLSDLPQAKFLQVAFRRRRRICHESARAWPVVALAYRRGRVGISTPHDSILRGWTDPTWEIQVSPVPKTMRHAINSLLLSEAFPKLRLGWRPALICMGTMGAIAFRFGSMRKVKSCATNDLKAKWGTYK